MIQLIARAENWPLRNAFTISRGSRTQTEVVVAELRDGELVGRGECMANPRYGETQEKVIATLDGLSDAVAGGLDRAALQSALPAGAARNALDCAFWDLEAKRAGKRVWELAGLATPGPVETAYTLSLDTPEKMGEAAREAAERPLLKLKITGAGDLERVAAVRENAPEARLIVDANEGWTPEMIGPLAGELAELGVEMVEQPLPSSADEALRNAPHRVPFCADESCHTAADLERLCGLYEIVNIKLDKTGGLTEALVLAARAEALGLEVMVGCMVATSLAMAPAILPAQTARYVDLDGPLLLAKDRDPPLRITGSLIQPPEAALWG